jgi:3(or 17)beta-hydroxysteroid dehydrogenase
MSINLDGVFLGCRTLLPLLSAGGARGDWASVVNISSVAGLIGAPNQVSYNSSKAGVAHLTKSLAVEFARAGTPVRVNSIHPGCILTPMLEGVMDDWVDQGMITEDQRISSLASLCPMNKIGDPKDIAYGAVYLASPEARFVTGIELVIDGGWIAS